LIKGKIAGIYLYLFYMPKTKRNFIYNKIIKIMRKGVLLIWVGCLIMIGIFGGISNNITGTQVEPDAPQTKLTIVDIVCKIPPIQYDTDESFVALVSNDGLTTASNIKVAFYLDGKYRVTTASFSVPAESTQDSPPVTIHWPSDYRWHKLTAKLDPPYDGEYSEWFRASLS
jgi:hypothetical protein